MKSTFFGTALGLLLAFSVISYSKTFIQQQESKSAKIEQLPVLEVAGQVPEVVAPATPAEGSMGSSPANSPGNPTAHNANLATNSDLGLEAQTYSATAYSLRGRTASGKPVS